MDDLFDILIESGGKETKPAFPIVPGFEAGDCRAPRGKSVMAPLISLVSLPMPLALVVVTKALREIPVRPSYDSVILDGSAASNLGTWLLRYWTEMEFLVVG